MAHPPDKDEYNVVVAQRGQFARRWEWEIFRNGRPLPVPLRNGQFWSERSARLIAELQAAGVASPRAIAEALNERLVPPPRGQSVWRPYAVRRLMPRLRV
jgi:hypothetical protein